MMINFIEDLKMLLCILLLTIAGILGGLLIFLFCTFIGQIIIGILVLKAMGLI